MSYIKDAIDLLQDLNAKIENQVFASEVREILKLIMEAHKDQIETEGRSNILQVENANLNQWCRELESKLSSKIEVKSVYEPKFEPSEDMIEVLKFLAKAEASLDKVATSCDFSVTKAEYFLDQLFDAKLTSSMLVFGDPTLYHLTNQGRAYLYENGLLD